MRVCLAKQILSHTVAAGITVLANKGLISSDAIHTADFVEKMDQLFNCFNSKTYSSNAKFGGAMTSSSQHKEFLTFMLSYSMKLFSKAKGTLLVLMDGGRQ